MQISCPCLNLSAEVLLELDQIQDEDNLKPLENLQLSEEDALNDKFFSSFGLNLIQIIAKDENTFVERVPSLVEKRTISGWDIKKCRLCNLDVFAVNCLVPKQLLCSRSVLKQQLAIAELHNTGNVSPVFRIILPKLENIVDTAAASLSDDINRSVQNVINDYIKREQELLDERIHRFTEEQQAAFEMIKQNAKQERTILLTCLSQLRDRGTSATRSIENDGAAPDTSLTSSRPSTSLSVNWKDQTAQIESDNKSTVPIYFRPKSHSNPTTFLNSKRKRHSGGSTKSILSSHAEEQQFMFNMDDHDTSDTVFADTSVDDDANNDENGKGEDYLNYYPPPPLETDLENLKEDDDDEDEDDYTNRVLNQFGTSLPVTIPAAALTSRVPQLDRLPTVEDDGALEQSPKDVGASMQALARSIQAVDDPERLFGERPRRRWKTGEILNDNAQRLVYAGRRPQAF